MYNYYENNKGWYYIEANFIQSLTFDEFTKEGDTRGHYIPLSKDTRKKSNKFARIEAISPLFEQRAGPYR
ncbi:hypothetical protein JBKA6_0731 [Ichthyobacterium seriolicida]|uniref:Uncharacterized protein n=1 Tax=Ichthyobacterium seriolicida TaxID=242600 RepID=A0A1J1EB50_9FLAO|nr:hypothetical protein JBKA6_0731 [Ichthyobacterium seriolicida]